MFTGPIKWELRNTFVGIILSTSFLDDYLKKLPLKPLYETVKKSQQI